MKIIYIPLLPVLFLFFACENVEEEIEPCTSGYLWAKANIDGVEVCFEKVRYVEKNMNTKDAYIQLTIYNGLRNTDESINAFFSVPVEGIRLNTPYEAYDGSYYNAEDVVSGNLTFTYYNIDSNDKAEQRYAKGNFTLTTENPKDSNAKSNITGEFIHLFSF